MLIIKFSESEKEKNIPRLLFNRKKKNEKGIKRESITIFGNICSVIEISEKFDTPYELQRVLKVFNGRIIGSPKVLERFVPEENRFDFRPYFKRALISSLIKNFDDILSEFNICIRDRDFDLLPEYAELARKSKKLVVLNEENQKTSIFSQYCFIEYGVYVDFRNLCDTYSYNVFVDFSGIDESGKLFIKLNGKNTLIYPDPEYFISDSQLSYVLKAGVPSKIACAAFQTKPPEKINWRITDTYT